MAKSKKDQKAGDNSTQVQAEGNIHFGITVSEATEIARREAQLAVAELSSGALAKATERSNSLANRIIDVFTERQELLGAFAEPDFNFALKDASRAAASNDEEYTEDLLVDLLTNRAEQGGSARIRLVTSRAIVAADKLSLEALNGLTCLWAATNLDSEGSFRERLDAIIKITETLSEKCAPQRGKDWLEDLELLDLVRLFDDQLSSRKSYDEFIADKFPTYLVPGIRNSEPLLSVVLSKYPVAAEFIEDHPLKEGFKLISTERKDYARAQLADVGIEIHEAPELKQLLEQNQFGVKDSAAEAKLREIVKRHQVLVWFAHWWSSLPPLSFTSVGDAVGFVNTRRHINFQGAQNLSELFMLRETD